MNNKKILIIGGTGALGQTLTKRYVNNNKIIIFSRDEHKQVNLSRDFPEVIFQIGDVKDKESVLQALNEYKPDVVINTAALKHVPICEDNPYESVKTNVNLSKHQIETLMFISTDKACKPINVYGMCKAISERLYIDFADKQDDIKVVLCRYGNVLESTGSVIPFFKKILESGAKKLPITDERMTRFLLSLEESVDLIEWAFNHKESHGNIVVPNIKALGVVDLAKQIGKKYGFDDIDLDMVGIRAGEKLHEEMVSLEESLRTITYEKYFMITNKVINKDVFSFSSDKSLMSADETYDFLKKRMVI
jgi:UDP-N-acetylglucosamine 4,6-dehydratase